MRMEKARDEFERVERMAVRTRLHQWTDYYGHISNSTPGPAYSDGDKVADAIYQARRPLPSISKPDPILDLNVSDSTIDVLLRRARANDKYIIF